MSYFYHGGSHMAVHEARKRGRPRQQDKVRQEQRRIAVLQKNIATLRPLLVEAEQMVADFRRELTCNERELRACLTDESQQRFTNRMKN